MGLTCTDGYGPDASAGLEPKLKWRGWLKGHKNYPASAGFLNQFLVRWRVEDDHFAHRRACTSRRARTTHNAG